MLDKTENKVDRVMIDLTLKFTKQMQFNYFKDMNQVFFKLKHIEAEIVNVTLEEQKRE